MKHLLWLLLFPVLVSAHPGRTDEYGCHAGEYDGMRWLSRDYFTVWRLTKVGVDFSPIEAEEPPVDPPSEPPGDIVGTWSLNISLGDMNTVARLELGQRAALTGDFRSYDEPVTISGDNAAFDLDDPDFGRVAFDLTASGDSLQGTVRAQGQTGNVTGSRVSESEPPDPELEPIPGDEVTSGTMFYDKVESVYYNGQWRDPYAGVSSGSVVPTGESWPWTRNQHDYMRIVRTGEDAHYRATFTSSNHNTHISFPRNAFPDPSTGEVRTLYLSWYVRLSFTPDCGSHKFVRIRDSWGGSDPFGLSLTCMHMSYKANKTDNRANTSWEDLIPPRNQWSRIEMWIEADKGSARVWLNGQLKHDVNDIGSLRGTGNGMVPHLVGWNPSGGGWGSVGDTVEIDEIYASTTLDRNVPVR